MRLKKGAWRSFVFLDIPLFLLGLNYMLYNALSMDSLKMLLRIIAILLLIIGSVIQAKFSVKRLEFLAMILAVLSLFINGASAINFAVLIVFAICVKYPLDRIVNGAFKVNALLVIIMIILMALRVINNVSYISTMGRLRYTLGFANPNVAALFYSSAIYLLVVSRKKLKVSVVVFSLAMALVIYYYTNSRTTLLAMLNFCILEGIYSIINKKEMLRAKRIFGKCSLIIVDVMFALNLISVFIIDKFMAIDELLSFRISTFSRMINSSGVRCFLFGGTVETVDNFYYMLLFQYGIFIYLFVAILTHFSMKKMVSNYDIKYISLLVALFMVAMMESSLIRPEILVALVVWKVLFAVYTDNRTIYIEGE